MGEHARPTLRTVAQAAGVSVMTASNAYNRPDQIAAATRERVFRVARDLGYPGPNPAAQAVRRGSAGTVGVVLTTQLPMAFTDPGLVSILHGMASELTRQGQALLLVPSAGAGEATPVNAAIADAIVLCQVPRADPSVQAALDRHIPLVTISHPRLTGVPMVGVDNRAAASLAATHLLELGHRRFVIASFAAGVAVAGSHPVPGPAVADREDGFRGTLAEAGIPGDAVELLRCDANSRPAARTVLAEPLRRARRNRPTAVLAATDLIGLGALDAAGDAGLTVPREVSVTGFDGIEQTAKSVPPLTTVSQHLFEQGRLAAQVALGRIAGRRSRGRRLTAELIVRDSTAASPRG